MNVVLIAGLVVVVLAVVAGFVLTVRGRRTVERSQIGASPPMGGTTDGMLTCPSCAHRFERPDIMVVTKAVVKKYGPNPVQCPRCNHIWSTGGSGHRIP